MLDSHSTDNTGLVACWPSIRVLPSHFVNFGESPDFGLDCRLLANFENWVSPKNQVRRSKNRDSSLFPGPKPSRVPSLPGRGDISCRQVGAL